MHPSSFYDLRARYIYTPLYGPYSLSEALEGLVFYPLDESRDSISIGSKRTLHHELISELSNVVDDLQDYLIYFSSKFLISPSDSLDFFKELRAGCDGFEPLSAYWGAIITRLVIARKTIERNFWPHLFQPIINDQIVRQRLGRLPSLSPNTAWNKPPPSTSAYIPFSQTYKAPSTAHSPLKVQRLHLNVQSERTRATRSNTNPTGSKEDHTPSSSLITTPTPSGPCPTRIPSNTPSSAVLFELCSPRTSKNYSDEVLAPPHDTIAAQCFHHSTVVQNSETREAGDLKDNVKPVGMDEQIIRETDIAAKGEEVTMVLHAHYPPPLASVRTEDAGEPILVSAETSPSLMASPLTSTAPYTANSPSNFHQGRSFPSPRSFVNARTRPPTCISSKKQCTQQSACTNPFRSCSTTKKQQSTAQPQRFGSWPVSPPATLHFRRQPLDIYPTYPPLGAFQVFQAEQPRL